MPDRLLRAERPHCDISDSLPHSNPQARPVVTTGPAFIFLPVSSAWRKTIPIEPTVHKMVFPLLFHLKNRPQSGAAKEPANWKGHPVPGLANPKPRDQHETAGLRLHCCIDYLDKTDTVNDRAILGGTPVADCTNDRPATRHGCSAPEFLDSGLTVFASTLPRPARRGRVGPGRDFDSRISPASTVRCMSA